MQAKFKVGDIVRRKKSYEAKHPPTGHVIPVAVITEVMSDGEVMASFLNLNRHLMLVQEAWYKVGHIDD